MTHTTETETIDRLFLELSQFTKAKTGREIELEKASVTRPLSQTESSLLIDSLGLLHDRIVGSVHQATIRKLVDLIGDDKVVIRQL